MENHSLHNYFTFSLELLTDYTYSKVLIIAARIFLLEERTAISGSPSPIIYPSQRHDFAMISIIIP